MNRFADVIRTTAKKESALSMKEEARLATTAHCLTMGLFRSWDLYKARRASRTREGKFLQGWTRQCFNKAVDDELFGSNCETLLQVAESQMNLVNPLNNPYYKAAIGVLARFMTLTVTVPLQNVIDPVKRQSITKKSPKVPLYMGFTRQALKECIYTASFVITSAYFNDALSVRRAKIRDTWQRCLAGRVQSSLPAPPSGSGWKNLCGGSSKPDTSAATATPRCRCSEGRQDKSCCCAEVATEMTIAAGKAAAAGFASTFVVAPIEYYGRPKTRMLQNVLLKAGRKGSYNIVNTLISKTMQKQQVNRVLAQKIADRVLPSQDF